MDENANARAKIRTPHTVGLQSAVCTADIYFTRQYGNTQNQRQTHTHTDTRTHTHTDNPPFSGPRRSQYIQLMKMTECKKRMNFHKFIL